MNCDNFFPLGASPKSCLTRWCVTGRAVPKRREEAENEPAPNTPYWRGTLGASPKSCLTRWCVTGRAVPKRREEAENEPAPNTPYATFTLAILKSIVIIFPYSLLPIPDSRFPIPFYLGKN
ncbi:MAG: hypothetical protein F6K26_24995 [Moorea sp. SIO2I5]|nr:hypothetical protein [Moorena sp. SIO2I5]